MLYAINVADLTKYKDNFALKMMLGQPGIIYNDSNVTEIAECEKGRIDGVGAVIQCEEDRAKSIVEVIRMNLEKHELRCYESKNKKGAWKRI